MTEHLAELALLAAWCWALFSADNWFTGWRQRRWQERHPFEDWNDRP